MRHLTVLPSILLAACTAAHAAPDLHVRELSRCDRSFFEKLGEAPAETQALAPMRRLGASAAFSVPDPRHPTRSKLLFTKPVDVAGTTVVGYFDEVRDMPRGMSSYAWGYLIAGSVAEVASKLQGLVWDPMRLFIRFGCAMQGNITEPLLRSIRPDLRD